MTIFHGVKGFRYSDESIQVQMIDDIDKFSRTTKTDESVIVWIGWANFLNVQLNTVLVEPVKYHTVYNGALFYNIFEHEEQFRFQFNFHYD